MSPTREILVDLLLNAFLQITLFAIVAASFSRLIGKTKAKYQYVFYLAVLLLCVASPVVNTFWDSYPIAMTEHSVQPIPSEVGAARHPFSRVGGSGETSGSLVSNRVSRRRLES